MSFYLGAVEAIQAQGCLLLELSQEIHMITHPLENLRQDLTLRSRVSCPHLDHGSFAGIFAYLQMGNRASLWSGQSGGGCEECGRFVSCSEGDVFSERNCSTLHKGGSGPEPGALTRNAVLWLPLLLVYHWVAPLPLRTKSKVISELAMI